MFPEAPGRFSTTIGCPNPSAIFWATKRAELSVAPPGGNPRTRRIGRCGNSRPCAPARAGTQPPAASRRERRESCEAMQGSDATQCEEKHPVNRFIMEAIVGYESFHRIRVYSGQAPTPALWRTVRIRQPQAHPTLPTHPNTDKKKAKAKSASTVKNAAQQIWRAGLGAFSKAQQEGGKVFEALVKEGLTIQRKTQAVAEEKLSDAS